jgi:hypothetical protein
MRGGWRVLGAAWACLFMVDARAECLMPQPAPTIPDGKVATDADMHAGHDTLQAFVNKLQDYQVCLEKQIKAASPDTRDALKMAWRAQGNAAIDEASALAADYAQQLQLFKSLHPAKPGQK